MNTSVKDDEKSSISANYSISVFDECVPYTQQETAYSFSINSTFKLGWHDSNEFEKQIINLHSEWTEDDLNNCGIYQYIKNCIDKTPWFNKKTFCSAYLNLIRPGDVHFIHTHSNFYVSLYYVNIEWKDGWYGETIFYDKNAKNIEFTSRFIPGRIILFDGRIPHSIRPQSCIAPKYRLSISCFFQ